MIIESDGNGGWFIGNVDGLNASIHLTEEWLIEYERHQGPQHRLRFLLQTGSTDVDDVADTMKRTLTNRRPSRRRNTNRRSELAEWHKGRRENRRQNT